MSDERALLAAIWEHPHEDTPRLAYADWLQENGGESGAARAELIRVQCELAGLDGDDPRYDAVEAREAELLGAWQKRWWAAMPAGARQGHFSHGFPVPSLGRFSIAGMVKLGAARLKAAPLWRYHYGVHGTDLDALLGWPFLHRLELFALRPPLPAGWAGQLAAHPDLRNVADLSLLDCRLTAGEVKLLLDAWAGRPLRSFSACLDADGLRVLADHPTAAGLRGLQLTSSRLDAAALAAFPAGRHLTGLVRLSLSYNSFGDAGIEELLRWPGMRKVRRLFIDNTGVGDAGVAALADSPACASLRALWLSHNPVGEAAALAATASPNLASLKRVSFYGTPAAGSPAIEAAVRARFGRGNY